MKQSIPLKLEFHTTFIDKTPYLFQKPSKETKIFHIESVTSNLCTNPKPCTRYSPLRQQIIISFSGSMLHLSDIFQTVFIYSVPFTCFDYKIAQLIFYRLLSITIFNVIVQCHGAHLLPPATESQEEAWTAFTL